MLQANSDYVTTVASGQVAVAAAATYPRPWHCFGPLMPARSTRSAEEGSPRSCRGARSPRRCSPFGGAGTCVPRMLGPPNGTEAGSGNLPCVCAVLPADSDGEDASTRSRGGSASAEPSSPSRGGTEVEEPPTRVPQPIPDADNISATSTGSPVGIIAHLPRCESFTPQASTVGDSFVISDSFEAVQVSL
eukprot:TRINITY_DN20679_c0_g1_i1.p1 TRINITY_DN20679_c0_g1~~TRINITY_DN20679_c0_g1_i1.p1  ORF type:complete len:222 (-),score=15.25 TRINITY_DN20679_c0_g1_i1:196-765(-)